MFRRVRRQWLGRAMMFLRWSRAAGYFLVALAGLLSIVRPPVSVQAATGHHVTTYVWAGVMMVAATMCAIGSISGRWVGEYVGLVPLCLVSAAFGIAALSRGNNSVAGGLFLLGFFWILLSRWQEVALLRVESVRRQHEREDGDQ